MHRWPEHFLPREQESPIFQLQVTFAAMQHSALNTFNPVKLVESLKLRATEQQDAQEYVAPRGGIRPASSLLAGSRSYSWLILTLSSRSNRIPSYSHL